MFQQIKRDAVALSITLGWVAAVTADSDPSLTLPALAAALTWIGFSALTWVIPAALISALFDLARHYYQETAMSGYANRVITLRFEELTEEGEPEIHVVMRNPRLMPPGDLVPENVELDENNQPTDLEAAKKANNGLLAKLIIGWRVYDASDIQIDADGYELDQEPLPLPATAELVGKLPTAIFMAMIKEVTDAVNPQ